MFTQVKVANIIKIINSLLTCEWNSHHCQNLELFFSLVCTKSRASLVAQQKRISLTMQKTGVQLQGQEDPWEKEIATYSSILAWEISWTEESGRLLCLGVAKE